MVKWQEEVKRFASIAYETGQQMIFAVNVRGNSRKWKIFLKDLKSQGEDEIDEE